MSDDLPKKKEVGWLEYRGNAIPRFLRVYWTLIIVFSIYYLVRYMWPDLQLWLNR